MNSISQKTVAFIKINIQKWFTVLIFFVTNNSEQHFLAQAIQKSVALQNNDKNLRHIFDQ